MAIFLVQVLEPFANALGIEDETITSVAASSIQLYPDEIDNPTTRMIYDHSINNVSLTHSIQRELYNGALRNINKYYNYGLTHYVHGVPTSVIAYTERTNTAVIDVLESIKVEPVNVDGIFINLPSPNIIIKFYLQENTGYSLDTNKLLIAGVNWEYTGYTLNGTGTAYIAHISNTVTTTITSTNEITIVTSGGTETTTIFERTVTQVDNGTTITSTTVESTPVVTVGPDIGGINDGTFSVPLQSSITPVLESTDYGTEIPIAGSGDYYTVIYALQSAPSNTLLWSYRIADGTYPTLNILPPTGADTAQMLPIAPLRQNFTTLNFDVNNPTTPESEEYTSTAYLLNIVNIDLAKQIKALEESESIDQIEDAYIHFGLPLYTQTACGMEVLFDTFNGLIPGSGSTKTLFDVPDQIKPINRFSVEEDNFNSLIIYNYIEDSTKSGVIGAIGECTNSYTLLPDVDYQYPNLDPDDEDLYYYDSYITSYITLQKQITSNSYIEIEVHGLTLTHTIPAIDGFLKQTTLLSDDEVEQGNFIIPLGLFMLNGYGRDTAFSILRESAHMTVYARQDVFVDWYQSEDFFNLIGSIAQIGAIISLFYGQASLSQTLFNLGAILFANAVLTELLVQGLESADSDLEKGTYVALYVYAVVALNSPTDSLELSTAAQMVQYVSVITNALSVEVQLQLDKQREEQEALDAAYELREDEIQTAYDELNPDTALSASDVYALVTFNPNETVDHFYRRTGHTNNPGIRALSEIRTFVARAVRLPEFEHNI